MFLLYCVTGFTCYSVTYLGHPPTRQIIAGNWDNLKRPRIQHFTFSAYFSIYRVTHFTTYNVTGLGHPLTRWIITGNILLSFFLHFCTFLRPTRSRSWRFPTDVLPFKIRIPILLITDARQNGNVYLWQGQGQRKGQTFIKWHGHHFFRHATTRWRKSTGCNFQSMSNQRPDLRGSDSQRCATGNTITNDTFGKHHHNRGATSLACEQIRQRWQRRDAAQNVDAHDGGLCPGRCTTGKQTRPAGGTTGEKTRHSGFGGNLPIGTGDQTQSSSVGKHQTGYTFHRQ